MSCQEGHTRIVLISITEEEYNELICLREQIKDVKIIIEDEGNADDKLNDITARLG